MSAALVDPAGWSVHADIRLELDADAAADAILERFRTAAAQVTGAGRWGVAMPDPFDYARGVGRFEGVGKFAALRGVDVRAALGLDAVFVNDADAFALGEWTAGAARGSTRTVGLTLGTGVGTGWLVGGVITDPGDPPGGRLHRATVDGVPLEDVVSRRAIRAAYGDPAADVREIAERARAGEARARAVLDTAFATLGAVLGPRLRSFGADRLVVGGSMAASWDLFDASFRERAGALPPVFRAAREDAALVGAAVHAAGDRDTL